MLPAAVSADGGEFIFDAETGTITGYTDDTVTELVIPAEIDGVAVRAIGERAFFYLKSLRKVTMPDCVEIIEYNAFEKCESLLSVSIGKNLKWLSDSGLSLCASLTEINVAEDNETYASSDGVLYSKDMGTLIFCPRGKSGEFAVPDGVAEIEHQAFAMCNRLTSVTIPASVTEISYAGFSSCHNLTAITAAKDHNFYVSFDGILYSNDKTTLVCCPGERDGEFAVPDGVTTIGRCAFEGCAGLTRVTIPDSVTEIGNYAFCFCTRLASVAIPGSVTEIGDYAFCYCGSLTNVKIPQGVEVIGDCAFQYCTSLTGVTLPESVEIIKEGAFSDCTSLTSMEIPDGVMSIRAFTFDNCSSLTSVTIPKSVSRIGIAAFNTCTSLTDVTIPNGVAVASYAFDNCDSLKTVRIDGRVTWIGWSAFNNCPSLTDVYYSGTETEWNEIEIEQYNDPLINANIHFGSLLSAVQIRNIVIAAACLVFAAGITVLIVLRRKKRKAWK